MIPESSPTTQSPNPSTHHCEAATSAQTILTRSTFYKRDQFVLSPQIFCEPKNFAAIERRGDFGGPSRHPSFDPKPAPLDPKKAETETKSSQFELKRRASEPKKDGASPSTAPRADPSHILILERMLFLVCQCYYQGATDFRALLPPRARPHTPGDAPHVITLKLVANNVKIKRGGTGEGGRVAPNKVSAVNLLDYLVSPLKREFEFGGIIRKLEPEGNRCF